MTNRQMYKRLDPADLAEFIERANEYYQGGHSLRETADKLRCPYTTLYGRLRKAGIQLRSQRGV